MWVLFTGISFFLLKVEYKKRGFIPFIGYLLLSAYYTPSTLYVLSHLAFMATLNGVYSYRSCFTHAETDLPKATKLVTTQPG